MVYYNFSRKFIKYCIKIILYFLISTIGYSVIIIVDIFYHVFGLAYHRQTFRTDTEYLFMSIKHRMVSIQFNLQGKLVVSISIIKFLFDDPPQILFHLRWDSNRELLPALVASDVMMVRIRFKANIAELSLIQRAST